VASAGVWCGCVDGAGIGTAYRYRVTAANGERVDKSDPLGAAHHLPPSIASPDNSRGPAGDSSRLSE